MRERRLPDAHALDAERSQHIILVAENDADELMIWLGRM